jgi:hypothetical protein
MTDALMELIKSGAVTNKKKLFFKKERNLLCQERRNFYQWLDHNSQVEFQNILSS